MRDETDRTLESRLYPANKILNAVRVTGALGMPVDKILSGVELSLRSLEQAKTRISLGDLVTVYRNILSLEISPNIGFRIGRALRPAHYGAYGFAIATSETLGDALDVGFSYYELETPTIFMSITLDHETRKTHFVFRDTLQIAGLHRFNVESHTALVLSFLRCLLGDDRTPLEAWFDYPAPDHASAYTDYLQCPCRFEQPYCAIIFPTKWLQDRLIDANPISAEAMRQECDRAVEQMRAHQRVASQVLRFMQEDLHAAITIEQVAQRLAMSSRTLRRYLVEEGTTFKQLLSEYRLRRAIHLLKNRRLSADEVSHRLGYAETPNFRAAFKRWTGLTVGEFQSLNPDR